VIAVVQWPRRKRQAHSDRPQGRRPGAVRQWSGTEVKIDGVEYLIMKESDRHGVIEQTSARKKGRLRRREKHNGEQKWLQDVN